MNNYLVVDIETTATEPWNGKMLCLSAIDAEGSSGCWVEDEIPQWVLDALASPSIPIVSHGDFDPLWLTRAGYKVEGPLHNMMVMAHILDENTPLDLEYLANFYCGITMDKRLEREGGLWFRDDDGKRWKLDDPDLPLDQVMQYCMRDTETEDSLYTKLYGLLDARHWAEYWLEEEVPFTRVILDMELNGLPIDLDAAAELRKELAVKFEDKERELVDMLGYSVNFGSWQQLTNVLFTKVWQQADRIPITKEQRDCLRERCDAHPDPKRKTPKESNDVVHQCYSLPKGFYLESVGTAYAKGYWMRKGLGLKATPPNPNSKTKVPSTSTPMLLTYHADNLFVQELCLHYRKLDKVINTYLDVYPKRSHNGRLYGGYNQAGTDTHRLSSRGPNMQNQPRRGELGKAIRSLFVGNLIVGDYSQLEPRLMAHFSQDPVLLDIYRNNKDIYLEVGQYIFGKKLTKEDDERDMSKTLVLAMGYGAYGPRMAQTMCLNGYPTTVDEGDEYLRHLQELFSGFFGWKKHIIKQAKQDGYVKSIGGRMRRLKWAFGDAKFKVRNKGERQAVNAVIQGSAADVVRRAMNASKLQLPGLPILAQVHDEIVWESEPGDLDLLNYLTNLAVDPGYDLSVPLKFEPVFCNKWSEKDTGIEYPEDDDE